MKAKQKGEKLSWRERSDSLRSWWVSQPIDAKVPLVLVLLMFVGLVGSMAKDFVAFLLDMKQALPITIVTNDLCGLCLHAGVLLLWGAMCFGSRNKCDVSKKEQSLPHRILSTGFMGHNFMAGGFAPRIFACAIGMLVFVNQNIVMSFLVPGRKFLKGPPSNRAFMGWPAGITCRADATYPKTWLRTWFSRFQVEVPKGCYMVDTHGPIFVVESFDKKPTADIPNLVFPWMLGTGSWLANGTVVGAELDKSRLCVYQCSKFRKISVQDLLLHSGAILAGGLFIERLTNLLTRRYGFKLVTRASKEKDVAAAVAKTLARPVDSWDVAHLKRTVCLLGMVGAMSALTLLTPRLDKDGFYTVDYYVTAVFLFSVVVALVFRSFHPYHLTPIIFTDNLWIQGQDTFMSEDGVFHKIDLYEWFHIDAPTRASYLVNYARTISLHHAQFYVANKKAPQTSSTRPKKADAVGRTGDAKDSTSFRSLQERLLDVESRLAVVENNQASEAELDDREEEGDSNEVECIQEFHGFSDAYCEDQAYNETEGDLERHFGWMRCRVVIKKGAKGTILGKTHDNQLMVAWGDPSTADKINQHVAIDPVHLLEVNEKWQELTAEVDAAIREHTANETNSRKKGRRASTGQW